MTGSRWWVGGLLAALLIAAFLSPWASPWPDGLDRVAGRLGFRQHERAQPSLPAPLAGYKLPGTGSAGWSTAAAGVVGTLVVFAGTWLWGGAITRRRSDRR